MNKISEFLLKIIIKDETNFKRIKNIIDKKERNPYVYAFDPRLWEEKVL